jgi:YHS domain-containing protein
MKTQMKSKTLVTLLSAICLVLMAASLVAMKTCHSGATCAEFIDSNSCSVCAPPSTQQKCIGCGMAMAEVAKPYVTSYQGKEYRFCSKECAADFEKDPAAYLAKHPVPKQ